MTLIPNLSAALNFDWAPLLPVATVMLTGMAVMLAGARLSDEESEGLGWLSFAGLSLATLTTLLAIAAYDRPRTSFAGALSMDEYTAFFYLAILLSSAVVVLMSVDYVRELELPGTEYYALLLFATSGMMLMASAADLIVVFLGLETMSIAVYVMAAMARSDAKSTEAGLKYFILGAFSTGFLLYGIALIYGSTGSIKFSAIVKVLEHSPVANSPTVVLGMAMMLVGFGFKVAAAPFHAWTPDAYEGAPTPVTAFMAVGVKLAAFAGFIRVFFVCLGALKQDWTTAFALLAVLTMITGNFAALAQSNIKRMLAYSAIAHAGYILVGMTGGSQEAAAATLYYLLGYAFTNLGAFAVIVALEKHNRPSTLISDYKGLSADHPALAALMSVFLLSLVGVPPLAGFVGKFYVFSAALEAGYVGLVVLAVINSVISAYYYIRVIVMMYMEEAPAKEVRLSHRPGLVTALVIALIGAVLIGVYPHPYMEAASSAYQSTLAIVPAEDTLVKN